MVMKYGAEKATDKLRRKLYSVPIKLFRCHNMGGNQAFKYDFKTNQIIHMSSNLCLDKPIDERDTTLPVLNICDAESKSQIWLLNSNFKWQVDKQNDKQSSNNENNEIESDM